MVVCTSPFNVNENPFPVNMGKYSWNFSFHCVHFLDNNRRLLLIVSGIIG